MVAGQMELEMQIDKDTLWAKFEDEGEEKTREKVDLGLYAGRKLDYAKVWLNYRSTNVFTSDEWDHASDRPVNIFFVITDKIKPIKWLLSKIGITGQNVALLEEEGDK